MSNYSNMRILIVDDYSTMRRVICNLLGQIGIKRVEEATDGQAALDMIRGNSYDLIISDWNMEPMSGIDLLRAVRGNAAVRDLPFIMVTAESKTENIIAAKQAGVNNYIVKPFSAETLKTKIDSVMGAKIHA